MAIKIKFNDFKSLVDNGEMPIDLMKDYLEQDPTVSIPKLRFKHDALIDTQPEDYDVNDFICRLLKALKIAEREKKVKIFGFKEKPVVVAEGDSWFRLPPIYDTTAIASRIGKNPDIDIVNIACWGDTLSKILSRKEYMKYIGRDDTKYFMLSAGGNDLQGGISRFIHDYKDDPQRPVNEYLTDDGKDALKTIGEGYQELLSEVSDSCPNVKILLYGYDYPRPSNGGQFIGQFLEKKGIPENIMKKVIEPVIDKLNDIIEDSASRCPRATYINCLNLTDKFTWRDDMHPNDDGFRALANKFENEILLS